MKKYIVRNKITQEIFGEFETKKEASYALAQSAACLHIDDINCEEETPNIFDYDVEEKEIVDILSYEDAMRYLGLENGPITAIPYLGKHREKSLLALSQLLIIADAWNKAEGFEPTFIGEEQVKYLPIFKYIESTKCFICSGAYPVSEDACRCINPRLCFSSHSRAVEFGERFKSLYNDYFSMNQ